MAAMWLVVVLREVRSVLGQSLVESHFFRHSKWPRLADFNNKSELEFCKSFSLKSRLVA